MTIYIIAFTILLAFMLVYLLIAEHYNIIDKPNERSSHSRITIRGGGIIFPIAALLWFFFFGFQQPWLMAGLIIVSVISFLDDIMNIPNSIRSIAHLLAVSLLFWQLQLFGLPWYILLSTYIITIGWINAVNFMDGINGITALYSLLAIISFYWVSQGISFVDTDILVILGFSVLIFTWFNLRRQARVFAGDIGSVSIAFLLAWFMISLIKTTNEVGYILFFAVYAIDSVITILFRLYKGENIFKAHRSHLYQYLCNELKCSHISVSIFYSIVQLLINIIALYLINSGYMNFAVLILISGFLSCIYLFIRFLVLKKVGQIANLACPPTGGSS